MSQRVHRHARILLGCVTAIAAVSATPPASPDAAGLSTIVTTQSGTQTPTGTAGKTDPTPPDERARTTEQQMTDNERFALLVSLSGATRFFGGVRDRRYPKDAPLTAGYTVA